MLPAGLLIFAWCSLPQVHWIGLNIGIVVCFFIAPDMGIDADCTFAVLHVGYIHHIPNRLFVPV
jgi:hypothetical protein